MHEKTVRVELAGLLKNVQTERTENIKRAFQNGRAATDARSVEGQEVQAYSNKHFRALICGVGDLVGLVER